MSVGLNALSQQRLNEALFDLDIHGTTSFNEFNRTHWCIKKVDLIAEDWSDGCWYFSFHPCLLFCNLSASHIIIYFRNLKLILFSCFAVRNFICFYPGTDSVFAYAEEFSGQSRIFNSVRRSSKTAPGKIIQDRGVDPGNWRNKCAMGAWSQNGYLMDFLHGRSFSERFINNKITFTGRGDQKLQ